MHSFHSNNLKYLLYPAHFNCANTDNEKCLIEKRTYSVNLHRASFQLRMNTKLKFSFSSFSLFYCSKRINQWNIIFHTGTRTGGAILENYHARDAEKTHLFFFPAYHVSALH